MKIMMIKNLGATLVFAGALAGCTASHTPDTASTSTAPSTGTASTPAEHASAPNQASEVEPEAVQIPATADGIWNAIDQQMTELKATIQSGSLKEVHHKAFAIRDLVAALPAQSKALPAEEQTKLESQVKLVATLADRLDATGDANDKAGAQANYDKLVSVLNGITRTK